MGIVLPVGADAHALASMSADGPEKLNEPVEYASDGPAGLEPGVPVEELDQLHRRLRACAASIDRTGDLADLGRAVTVSR